MLEPFAVVGTGPNHRPSEVGPGGLASPVSTSRLLRVVLPGMVARGLGVEALCAYLNLARAALLDLVVELDLPTPHDRALRRSGGRNPWTLADTALFILLWMAGWHAESLGERFGRTAGGVRAKARRLGLPRRDRKLVFRPAQPGRDLPSGVLQGLRPEAAQAEHDHARPAEPIRAASSLADDRTSVEPAAVLTRAAPATDMAVILPFPSTGDVDLFGPTPVGTPPRCKPKRHEVEWTRERDQELSQRWWARQHFRAIARDMGISPSAVQSRRLRLQLPSFRDLEHLAFMRRDELVDHFDPSVVEAHIAAAGYIERKCNTFASDGKEFWFWTPRRNGSITSKEVARLERKRANRFSAPLLPPVRPCAPALHAW